MRLAGEMTFPWLMSNVQSSHTGELLADGKETHIIDWEGRKVGREGKGREGKGREGKGREGGGGRERGEGASKRAR